MDFNIYDFYGNPPSAKKKKVRWCPVCLMYMPVNEHLGTCDICGEPKPNPQTPSELK